MALKMPLIWLLISSIFGFILWIFVFVFPWSQKEPIVPKDRIVVNTEYITGNTYNVSLDTKKLPAL
jgi:hypothetical protein